MRFFRSRKPPAAADPTLEVAESDVAPPAETDDDDELPPSGDDTFDSDAEAREWRDRADAVIPGGASTGSKRAAVLLGDDADDGFAPAVHYVRASGCELVTVTGQSLVDCT